MDKRGFVAKAWITLNNDKPRDRFGNLVAHQYNDPGYGFNLNAVLKEYGIKELKDEKLFSSIEAQMHKGNRVSVTVEKGTKEEEMFIEAAVRYSKINFFDCDDKVEKRGQFEVKKETSLMQGNGKQKENAKEKGVAINS